MSDTVIPDTTSRDERDAERALATPVFDALWMLGRQWQTGELQAEDAGSAVGVQVQVEHVPIRELETPQQTIHGAAAAAGPLQLAVDAEPRPQLGERPLEELASAGLELLRTLDDHDAGAARPVFLDAAHRLDIADDVWARLEPASQVRLRPWRGRVPDPRRIAAETVDALGPRGDGPGPFPPWSGLDDDPLRARVEAAVRDWLRWLDPVPDTPGRGQCWLPDRLESSFTLVADTDHDRVRLRAPEHLGDELDWHSFVRSSTTLLRRPRLLPSTRLLPAPVRFAGMPLPRFWELEAGDVNLELVAAKRDDVGAQALLAFVHQHADDWLSVPLELPVGSVAFLRSVEVTTTFGERIPIPGVAEIDGIDGRWQLFSVSPDPDAEVAPVDPVSPLVLVHGAGRHLTGPQTESLLLLRDEMANLAWAVEQLTRDGAGLPVDRFARHLRLRSGDGDSEGPGSQYKLGSTVPDYWYPLEAAVEATGRPVLALSSLPGSATGVEDAGVQGTILDHSAGAQIRDEEVPREGASVTRRWHRARWTDGSTHTWLARAKRPGLGEGSSGLRFDYLEHPERPAPVPARLPGFHGEVLADEPLIYLRLGEPASAATAADSSGNGNHGVVMGGITFAFPGLGAGGTAARFHGSGAARIAVRDRGQLMPRHLTLEALVSWTGPIDDTQQRIIERSTDDTGWMASFGLSILSTGHVRVELTTEHAEPFLTSVARIVPDAPTHLAATCDGSTLSLYIDGALDSSMPAGGPLRLLSGVADVGVGNQAQPLRPRGFNGTLDEIAVYGRALPAERLRAHVRAVASDLGNLVRNPRFEHARPVVPPPLVGLHGGMAAAEEWYLWNNLDVTTISELIPTTRPGGSGSMLHLITGGGSCGLVQAWANTDTGPDVALVQAWVCVVRGSVMLGCGNGGNTGEDVRSTQHGEWELLEAPNGVSPANEVIVYASDPEGAEYFVDHVAVRSRT